MTSQLELDDDLKCVLNAHLITRRDLLKRVKAELWTIPAEGHHLMIPKREVMDIMDRLIKEAEMPNGN